MPRALTSSIASDALYDASFKIVFFHHVRLSHVTNRATERLAPYQGLKPMLLSPFFQHVDFEQHNTTTQRFADKHLSRFDTSPRSPHPEHLLPRRRPRAPPLQLPAVKSRLCRLSVDMQRKLCRALPQAANIHENIEHARGLLLKLEHNGRRISTTENTSSDPDILQKRASLRRMQDRLFELNQHNDPNGGNDDTDDEDDSDDTQDFLSRYAPAIKTQDSLDVYSNDGQPPDPSQHAVTSAAGALESTLRSRKAREQTQAADSATTSGRAGTGGQVPSSTTPFAPKRTENKRSDNETLLSHHTSEQENLTDSLLALATALKNSTMSFSETLGASNPLVDGAVSALDKNVGGMAAAEKRMGMLRRMTEGRGWWSRLGLYGWIAVLWVALILIMFVMPKIRF